MYVVTLNYNLKTDTIACIESVLADGVAIEHVIVVDNGSTDDSVAALRSRFCHDLKLISPLVRTWVSEPG
jgi:GT2 family glycosyltransferase